jgi:Protein of unknown function (DUF2955)
MPTDRDAARTHDRRTARLGIGITIIFLIAMAFDWTLGYLAPVFALPMLQARTAPSPGEAAKTMLTTLLIALACYLAGGVARAHPAVFLLLLLLALLATFRYSLRGGSSLMVTVMLLALLSVPLYSKISQDIAWEAAASFVGNIGLSLLVTYAMFAVFPPLPTEPAPKAKVLPPPEELGGRAWQMAIITGAYAAAYFAFNWTNVLTPIYIGIFMHQVSLARGVKVTGATLLASLAGGTLATLLYELVVMAPNFLFMAMLTFAVFLWLARVMTVETPMAPLAGSALSVILLVYGAAMTSFGEDSGAASGLIDRLRDIGMAAIYSVTALAFLEAFRPAKGSVPAPPQKSV